MRFMAMVKPGKDYEAGKPPSPELMAAMGKLSQENQKLGSLRHGRRPAAERARPQGAMSGSKITVTDGPFAETKEVIGGFAIVNHASHEEAIAGARRVMEIHAEHGFTDLEIELRQMMDDPGCGAQVPQQASAA